MNLKIKLHFLDINGKPWVIEEKKLIKDSPLFIEPYDLQKRANP